LGMATCLEMLLFVKSELGYDGFHENAVRIVRVDFRGSVQGEEMNEADVMHPLAKALLANYPEVENATRIRLMGYPKITYDDKTFRNNSAAFVDSSFFRVFTFPLIEGNSTAVLNEPNTVVLSASTAKKFFGEEDPLGRELLMYDGSTSVKVTGIMTDMPANSHFQFDVLVSMSTFPESRNPSWMVSEYTYLLLQPGSNYKSL